jgi:hypothetical protein
MGNISDFLPSSASGQINPQNQVVFERSGTFTVPDGVTEMYVTAVGGGAAAGNLESVGANSVFCAFEDPTGRYSLLWFNNTQVQFRPKGGDWGTTGLTKSLSMSGSGSTIFSDVYDPVLYWGEDGGKVLTHSARYIINGLTLADCPFNHFDIATLDFKRGPQSSRGTGHYNGPATRTGRRYCHDTVAGYYYYYGADGHISRVSSLDDDATIDTFEIDLVNMPVLSGTGGSIDIHNGKGFATQASQFNNTADRLARVRYTTDNGETWQEPVFTGAPVSYNASLRGVAFSEDRSICYLYQFTENNSGSDVIWKSVDQGANWTVFAEIAVGTYTSAPANSRYHHRTIACQPDGSTVVVSGNYELAPLGLATSGTGNVSVFFDGDGNQINAAGQNAPDYGNVSLWLAVDGYFIGAYGGITPASTVAFDASGNTVAYSTQNMGFNYEVSSTGAHMAPSGYVIGGYAQNTATQVYYAAYTPGTANGKTVSVAGASGSVSVAGGGPKSQLAVSSSTTLSGRGGSSYAVGPFSDIVQSDLRVTGKIGSRYSGYAGSGNSRGAAPGGYDNPTEADQFLFVNGEGSSLEGGATPGGGGETVFRELLKVTPGETITITVPPGAGYCLPGIAVLEY